MNRFFLLIKFYYNLEALAEEENVVIAPKIPININKWEGEDEDDDVKVIKL